MRIVCALFPVLFLSLSAYAGEGLYPPGFDLFCEDYPVECQERAYIAPLKSAQWKETLERVNREVNEEITYRPDPGAVSGDDVELYVRIGHGRVPPGDQWTSSPQYGDCDDYAVTKYFRLIEAGAPRSALRFAYVLPHNGEPHLFLVVETNEGSVVLDSNRDHVTDLDRVPLTRLSIQGGSDPMNWRQIY